MYDIFCILQLSREHRVVLLESMQKILSDRRDVIQADLAKELLKLAFQEMTKSKVHTVLIMHFSTQTVVLF